MRVTLSVNHRFFFAADGFKGSRKNSKNVFE